MFPWLLYSMWPITKMKYCITMINVYLTMDNILILIVGISFIINVKMSIHYSSIIIVISTCITHHHKIFLPDYHFLMTWLIFITMFPLHALLQIRLTHSFPFIIKVDALGNTLLCYSCVIQTRPTTWDRRAVYYAKEELLKGIVVLLQGECTMGN